MLVLSEIALAMVMLTGAGLMVRSLLNARNVDPGFDPRHLAGITLGLHDYRYPAAADVVRFERDMIDRLRAIPAVTSASASSSLSSISISIEGRDLGKVPSAGAALVYPGYFETMRIPIRAGFSFTGRETTQSPKVAIVNETLARRFLAGGNPIGQRIKWGSLSSTDPWCTVIGVVGDMKTAALDAPQEPMVYFPALQADTGTVTRFMRSATYVVRTGGDPSAVFGAVRQAVKTADPELPIVGPGLVADGIARTLAGREFNTVLLGGFALLALVLAAAGIYGLMAYAVTQRTREIGIRLAIGATPVDVLRLVVGQTTRVALVGLVTGLIGALALTRVLRSMLFDVSPLDPITFVAATLVLFGIAVLAGYIPARRAAGIDPQSAIREG
jgi:putative ABC transport system permease protein